MLFLVTGASGLAGSHVVHAALRRGHRVVAVVHSGGDTFPGVERVLRIDLRDPAALETCVLDVFPDAIVHTAAVTENPACEADPAPARILNVDTTRRIAQLAHHLGARLVHFSTDLVFDGARAPYRPADPPAPRSLYGRLKAEAEEAVLAAAPETGVVLRPPLMTGDSPSGTRSVHERLFQAWSRGEVTRLFTDEVRQPCSAGNLADAVVEICERQDIRGRVHWAGAEALSRHEMGRRIAEHFRLPASWVVAVRAGDDPRFADRPRDLSMDLQPLAGLLRTRPELFEAQLERMSVPRPVRPWFHALPP